PVRDDEPHRSRAPAVGAREPGRGPRGEPRPRPRGHEARRTPGTRPHAGAQGERPGRPRRDGEGLAMSEGTEYRTPGPGDDGLVILDGSGPAIPVYGAPRPAAPERLPLTPRFGGCASVAGVGLTDAGSAAAFRRVPALRRR